MLMADGQITCTPVNPLKKNILIYRNSKSVDILIHPVPPKGRVAIVTFAGRAAVDAEGA